LMEVSCRAKFRSCSRDELKLSDELCPSFTSEWPVLWLSSAADGQWWRWYGVVEAKSVSP
jgi:hypothetical protein